MKTKTQITNRILSIFLCFVMLFSLTMPAMATEDDTYTLYINISQVVDSTKEVSGVYLWIQNDTESIIFNETMNNETGTVYSYSVPNSYTSGIIQFWYTDGEGSLNYYFDFDATGNNLYTPTGEEEGTWEVYSECPHESYKDGKCEDCGIDCPHKNYKDGKCNDCGVEGTFVTITMNDSYGDSWNGNAIKIEQLIDGVYTEVATATIEDGASETYTAVLPKDGVYAFRWVSGSYSEECSFTVTVDGEIVCESTDASEFEDGHNLYINCEHKNIIDCKCDVCSSYFHDWSNNDGICANGCDTICEHEAFTDSGVCKVCGYECSHNWNGDIVCDICGCYCEHSTTENGVCTECEYILPFLLTTGKNVTYHGSFADALDKAEDGSVIKLLKNYADYNGVEINKAITLDLNGKTWDQPSLGQHTVTADVTFTDSVGDGVCSYGFNLLSPCTFEGGSYRYIWIKYETGDTLEDLLAPCCSYYSNGEVVDLSGQTSIGSGIEISANHIPGTQNCLGYKCENCGKYFGEVDADAHDWSNKDGVCANGCGEICIHENQTDTCEICGATLHICDFSDEWKYDSEKHWKKCECGLTGEEGEHAWIFGECTECGYACEHSFTNYTETEAPTCTEAGKEVAGCNNDCGAMNEREIPELNHKDTLVQVEAKAPTCTEIGWDAYEYCTACDYTTYVEIPAGHTPLEAVKENEVAPKCGVAGSYDLVVYCDVCGDELDRDTTTVDALTHTDADGDYLCDYDCGHEFEKPVDPTPDTPDTPDEPTDGDCDHLCHKSGFIGFIWKIVQFFSKLFKINPTCECGVAHY